MSLRTMYQKNASCRSGLCPSTQHKLVHRAACSSLSLLWAHLVMPLSRTSLESTGLEHRARSVAFAHAPIGRERE